MSCALEKYAKKIANLQKLLICKNILKKVLKKFKNRFENVKKDLENKMVT